MDAAAGIGVQPSEVFQGIVLVVANHGVEELLCRPPVVWDVQQFVYLVVQDVDSGAAIGAVF